LTPSHYLFLRIAKVEFIIEWGQYALFTKNDLKALDKKAY